MAAFLLWRSGRRRACSGVARATSQAAGQCGQLCMGGGSLPSLVEWTAQGVQRCGMRNILGGRAVRWLCRGAASAAACARRCRVTPAASSRANGRAGVRCHASSYPSPERWLKDPFIKPTMSQQMITRPITIFNISFLEDQQFG